MKTLAMVIEELEALKKLHGEGIEVCFHDYEQGLTDITVIQFEDATQYQRHQSVIAIS